MYTVDDLLSKGDDFAGFLISCGANRFLSPGAIFEYFAETRKSSLLCYITLARYLLNALLLFRVIPLYSFVFRVS
jgi:hypothetical protein